MEQNRKNCLNRLQNRYSPVRIWLPPPSRIKGL